MLSRNPPPVMWASALTALVSRIAARQDLHIEARRREQRFAEASSGSNGAGASQASPDFGDNAAHQRKAVRMHAGGGEADHDVARRDIVARQQRVALDGADGKAGEVIVAAADRCRHLRRLAADQRAAGFAAALRRCR